MAPIARRARAVLAYSSSIDRHAHHRPDRRHELGIDAALLPAPPRGGAAPPRRPSFGTTAALLGAGRGTVERRRKRPRRGRGMPGARRRRLIVLCTNTMHKGAPASAARAAIPLLRIADPTGAAIAARGLRRVSVRGTRFTMEQPFSAQAVRQPLVKCRRTYWSLREGPGLVAWGYVLRGWYKAACT